MTAFSSVTVPLRIFTTLLLCTNTIDAKTAELGACFQPVNGSYRCAMSSSFCYEDQNENWFKPHELRMLDTRKLCSCEDAYISNCSPMHGHRGQCALEEMSCPAGGSFNPKVWFYNDGASCMCHGMVAHDYTTAEIETEKTMYGACSKDGTQRCAVYSTDCVPGEAWLSPIGLKEELNKECTCDRVRTGHCGGPSKQCVVNKESCDSPDQFVNAFDAQNGGVDCFLCADDVFDGVKVKTSSNDDDDDKTKVVASDYVSGKTFDVILGLMITGCCTTIILSITMFARSRRPKSGSDLKHLDGFVA